MNERTIGDHRVGEIGLGGMPMLTAVSAPAIDDYPYGEPGRAQRHRELSR